MAQTDSLLEGLGGPVLVFLAGATAAYLLAMRVWGRYRLRHIKGPLWAGWTDLWLIYTTARCEIFEGYAELYEKYGENLRPKYVACGDAAEMRRVWAYNGRGVEGIHESIDAGVSRFVRLIEKKYLSTEIEYRPVDFARKMQYHTIDLVSELAFGEPFGFVGADQDLWGYIRQLHDSRPIFHREIVAAVGQRRCWAWSLDSYCEIRRCETVGPGKIERSDILGSWIRRGVTQAEVEQEAMVQILAGADTTSSPIIAVIAHVITKPGLYRQMQDEIDKAAVDGRISSPVAYAEARKLPFLQACIKEALHMRPPVSGTMPKVSNEDTVVRRQLAYFMTNKTLVELFRLFDFAVINAAKPITLLAVGSVFFSDFKLRITKRMFDT
ncbi:hypothetical protein MFIFM68171_10007 [Madurella fahalii]|uniref:Cytochrome P450 n=1 Tax=Madurella fahalii TaxID=1157608 RepID=A0ABQ0GPW6_9PEZI